MRDTRTASRTVAVILAGGIGVRVGLGIPKQLIKKYLGQIRRVGVFHIVLLS